MVTGMIKSKMVRNSLEMAVLGMLARRALKEYLDSREANQWGYETEKQSSWTPRITIQDNENSYVIMAELAGVPSEELKLSINGNNLVLEGKRLSSIKSETGPTYMREIPYGSFYRTLPLPEDVEKDNDRIDASFSDGMLEIRVPRLKSEIPVGKVHIKTK